MVKYYCDQCEKEIPKELAHNKHVFTYGKIQVQTIRAVSGTWNAGQVCVPCIRKAIVDGAVKQELPGDPVCRQCQKPSLLRD